jgi:hypothetical protein
MTRTGKGNVGRSFAREGHKVHFRVLTPLGQRAAAGFMKHADALPDAAARVAAYRDAANYAGSGSALEQQAQKKLKELLQPEPARPAKAEIAAFVARFGAKAQN